MGNLEPETITREEFDRRLEASIEQERIAIQKSEKDLEQVRNLIVLYQQTLNDLETTLSSRDKLYLHSERLRARLQELAEMTAAMAAAL